MLKVQTVGSFDAVASGDWADLLKSCPDSTIFQSPGWLRSWWQIYGTDERQLRLVTVYEGDTLVALAPLFQEPLRKFGYARTHLRYIGEGHSDYQSFAIRDGSIKVAKELVAAVADLVDTDVQVSLREIPQKSVLGRTLIGEIEAGAKGLHLESSTPCPRLQIKDNSEGVAAILRKDSLRRHTKKLAKRADLEIEHLSNADQIKPLLPLLFEQHIQRWEGTPYPSMFSEPQCREFYFAVVEALCPEGIVFTTVRSGGELAAAHLGLKSRNDFIWYKPTFDPRLSGYSPGEVLLKALIEYAHENSFDAFDFTRGDEAFKVRFSSSVEHNGNFRWIPSHLGRQIVPWALKAARRVVRRVRFRKHAAN